ncbi:MAG TPA: tetratricopeptide repeat protein, partial [Candidatus Eisenbacteria bacterium]|nr:tetratricopeptide repeat protein [Candidatus Eisenbacteria bacterium]
LNTAVARLREALCDSAEQPRFIETLPKRGYRFIADIYAPPPAAAEPQIRRARLVVLPFVNLSGDLAQEYFSDAMTDELITALAGLAPGQLAVIARTTAMHYKASHKDVARIGRELNVDYVVEGGVRRTEDEVAINVQLIQTSGQAHLFARKYDAPMRDVFSLHNCIAQEIATHVPYAAGGFRGKAVGGGIGRKPTEDLVAYNLYIQGRYLSERDFVTSENFANGKRCFEAAVARDPQFALAYHSLADLYYGLSFMGFVSPKEALAACVFNALHALEIDNTLAETHALLAMCRVDYDWTEVRRELDIAMEMNAALPLVRLRNAIGLMLHARLDEAIREIELGLELDPMSLFLRCWLAVMQWLGRHYDRAVEGLQWALEVEPNYPMAYLVLGQTRCMEHKFDEAVAALRRAVELYGGAPMVLGWLGLSVAQGGNVAEASAMLERLHAMVPQGYVPPTSFAWIHLGLGETDSAFAWMERAVEARDHMIIPIKTYPFLDPLRGDPRFSELLRKMNLGA